jgi:L-2-hydroxyglutarate oxidase
MTVTSQRTVAVVGGGIVGLALARHLARTRPDVSVHVLEKEGRLAAHQTGHNSGVVHAGLYYPPGSLKATLCGRGMAMMREYCQEHDLGYRELGKVVVATGEGELERLKVIHERAMANQVPEAAWLDAADLAGVEPAVRGVAAVHSPRTAVVDFARVAGRLAQDVEDAGGEVHTGRTVLALEPAGEAALVGTGTTGPGFRAVSYRRYDAVVGCAGLGTDTLVRLAGLARHPRIVPFRGEYLRLVGPARDLVRGLVYPVPDPRYPFLGVHLTRGHDDDVHVGPNAVLALALEGYRRRDVSVRDVLAMAGNPGMWRLARQHWRTGIAEMWGSFNRGAFLRQAQAYVPQLRMADLAPAGAGVRAQAVRRDGTLVDDFVVESRGPVVVVRNAPSPAATSSLALAEHLAGLLTTTVLARR